MHRMFRWAVHQITTSAVHEITTPLELRLSQSILTGSVPEN